MSPVPNTVWARTLADELARAGVRDVCIAPGSRSTPLVLAFAADSRIRCRVHLDERSAGFFALGMGKVTGRPAAVLTTSGTAAANLYPAVVEASQSETPLLLLTADRPPHLRGTDANQTMDQVRLFGSFVRAAVDFESPRSDAAALRHLRARATRAVAAAVGAPAGPVHLNLTFEKPLEPDPGAVPLAAAGREGGPVNAEPPLTRISPRRGAPEPSEVRRLAEIVRAASRGLLVAGPSPDPARSAPALLRLAAATGFPLLADPLSGARFADGAGDRAVAGYDLFLRDRALWEALAPELVLRVGASPTSRPLLEFLEHGPPARQLVIDEGARWKDPIAAATEYVRADPAAVCSALARSLETVAGAGPAADGSWAAADGPEPTADGPEPTADGSRPDSGWTGLWHRCGRRALETAASEQAAMRSGAEGNGDGVFEGTVAARLAGALPGGALLFVGSSMPVRDLDAFGAPRDASLRVFGNRGASGIDGAVSTALGAATVWRDGPAVALLGDLSFLHDMNGLFAARRHAIDLILVVINNDGGGIFHFLPVRAHEPAFTEFFATPHGLDLSHAAAMYGFDLVRPRDVESFEAAVAASLSEGGRRIIEVRSDREANRRRHERVEDAVRRAVANVVRVAAEAGGGVAAMEGRSPSAARDGA